MNILEKLKQVFIPVNQPRTFPRLYFIPQTTTVHAPRQASNDSRYREAAETAFHLPEITLPRPNRYVMLLKKYLVHIRARAWSALKALGRRVVRWLARRVVFPLSVLCAVWIPYVSPAELTL